jgi:hypothetical protein
MTTPAIFDHGTVGTGTSTPDISKGLLHKITCSATTRTIADPVAGVRESPGPPPANVVTVPVLGNVQIGTELFILVSCTAASLAITWGSAFKQAATNPAAATRRLYAFVWDGANWVQSADGVAAPN